MCEIEIPVETVHILENHDYWQTPVITEKKISELISDTESIQIIKQNKGENYKFVYYSFPWATYIDIVYQHSKKEISDHLSEAIISMIKKQKDVDVPSNEIRFTVCQHIYFKNIIPVLKYLKIQHLFTPHAQQNINEIDSIFIHPIPLYPIHVGNSDNKKDILFSFIGAYTSNVYMSTVRQKIFDIFLSEKKSDLSNNCHVSNDIVIEKTNEWHFQKHVYYEQMHDLIINQKEEKELDEAKSRYLEILSRSRYSLCPSGSGPSSIRLWESLGTGAIPIILSDSLRLPMNDIAPEIWESSVIRVLEKDVENIETYIRNIDESKEKILRENGKYVFEQICGENGNNMHISIFKQLEHSLEQFERT